MPSVEEKMQTVDLVLQEIRAIVEEGLLKEEGNFTRIDADLPSTFLIKVAIAKYEERVEKGEKRL